MPVQCTCRGVIVYFVYYFDNNNIPVKHGLWHRCHLYYSFMFLILWVIWSILKYDWKCFMIHSQTELFTTVLTIICTVFWLCLNYRLPAIFAAVNWSGKLPMKEQHWVTHFLFIVIHIYWIGKLPMKEQYWVTQGTNFLFIVIYIYIYLLLEINETQWLS